MTDNKWAEYSAYSFLVEPAFPCSPGSEMNYGLTVRDYSAGQALISRNYHPRENLNKELAAKWCYEMADAMLKAREG